MMCNPTHYGKLESGALIRMPKFVDVSGVTKDAEADDMASWRSANGWLPVCDECRDTCPSGKVMHRTGEYQIDDGEICACFAAVDPSAATPDEVRRALKDIGERYTENDMKNKINEITSLIRNLCLAALLAPLALFAANPLTVQTATKGSVYNDEQIVTGVSFDNSQIDTITGYLGGERVRLSVTNYYGNTSGELPRFRIEEHIVETNLVNGVNTETNYWKVVWDEQDKYETFKEAVTSAVRTMTNKLYQTYTQLLTTNIAAKADRAWGRLTSAGTAAPPGMVWHTEPETVFAGGTEYAHVMVGSGAINVLTRTGAGVYTEGETGRFYFRDDMGEHYFGMNIQSRYQLGCDTDGILVGEGNLVSLTYSLTSASKPCIYWRTNLVADVYNQPWEKLNESTGDPVPGASIEISWEENPPAGTEICYINCGEHPQGFFCANMEYAGGTKFETNLACDLGGGIIATNVSAGQSQPIEPYIENGTVKWRVKDLLGGTAE